MVLCAAAVSQGATIQTVDGKPATFSASIAGFENGSLLVKRSADAAATKVPLADVVSLQIDQQDRAAAAAHPAGSSPAVKPAAAMRPRTSPSWRVELGAADHMTASVLEWKDNRVTLALDALNSAPLSVRLADVRAVWSTSTSRTKEAKDLNVAAESQDVAFVEKDGKVKAVLGQVVGLDREYLRFKFDGEERRIKLDRLVGVSLAQRESPPEKSLYVSVLFNNGDVLAARIEGLESGILRVAPLASEGGFAIPLAAVAKVDVINGRLTWVGDLKPAAVVQVPYFDRLMPYQVNRSLTGGPLTLSDGVVTRGIAVHSKCVLTYDIGGEFETFRGKIGFQQPEGKIGRAAVRVVGDEKVLWRDSDLKGDAKPSPLEINVSGVKTLTLEVDYGKNQDVGGRVVWGEVRLIKRISK